MTATNMTERRRRIRELALQMLYQIDARRGEEIDEVLHSLRDAAEDPRDQFAGPWKVTAPADPDEHAEAFERARGAWNARTVADRYASELSPAWPTHRQPALDRNLIRLCWYEMTQGGIPPKAAVNEAVELAKKFGTERSAHFLNGVLDKLLRIVLDQQRDSPSADADESADGVGANRGRTLGRSAPGRCEQE